MIERATQAGIVENSRVELQAYLKTLYTQALTQFDTLPAERYSSGKPTQLFPVGFRSFYEMTKPQVVRLTTGDLVSISIGKEKLGTIARMRKTTPSFLIDCFAVTKEHSSVRLEQYLLTGDGILERVTADRRDTEPIHDEYFLDAVNIVKEVVATIFESIPAPARKKG